MDQIFLAITLFLYSHSLIKGKPSKGSEVGKQELGKKRKEKAIHPKLQKS